MQRRDVGDEFMRRSEFEGYVSRHEQDRYAHAPILLDLHKEITDLQKLGWMVRGGLVVTATIAGSAVLLVILHAVNVI